jgi:hypothetical protein
VTPELLVKADDISQFYDADLSRAALTRIFSQRYVAMLRALHAITARALNLSPDEFRLDDPSVRRAVLEAGARAVRVSETTQKAIAAMIADGHARGLSNWEIANGTADFPGIERLFSQTWAGRGNLVARTELAHAQVQASINRFRASGIVGEVYARDGGHVTSDSPCTQRDGRHYPLNNPPQLLHPGCTLTVVPVLNV